MRDPTETLLLWLRSSFLAYQLKWALEPARFALALKGRQLGFTDGTAAGCILGGLRDKRPQIVLSAAQNNANELIEAVRTHCLFLAAIGYRGAADFAVDNTEEIRWRSGGSVRALAANPRTARSFHGDLWLDEFAYHQDAEALWKAAAPMVTRGDWRVRVFSTPNGAQGTFYDWCQSPPKGWAFHKVSLDDAERDGLKVDRAALLALVHGDPRVFGEAYLCQFLDADLQYLPSELVLPARDWIGPTPDFASAPIYGGLDVGRTVDLTVLTPGALVERAVRRDGKDRIERMAWTVATLTAKRTAFKAQKRMIFGAHERLGFTRLAVDKTGLGTQLAEELVEAMGEDVVDPVHFTNDVKADLATRVFVWLRDGRVRFEKGENGRLLAEEACAVRRKVTAHNNVIYESPRTANGHGDRFWSFALLLRAMDGPELARGMGDEPLFAVA